MNAAFVHDQLSDTSNSITKVLLPNDTIIINENHAGLNSYLKLLTGAILQANTKDFFLKDNLKFQRTWSTASDFLSITNINQQLKNPFINLINDLGCMINLNNNLIGINSFTSYSNLPQKLLVTPGQYSDILNAGLDYDGILQNVQLKGLFTDNSVSFNKKIGKLSFDNKIGILLQSQILKNDLNIEQSGSLQSLSGDFKNVIQQNRIRIYNEESISLRAKRINISIKFNVNLNTLESISSDLKQKTNRIFLNPNFNILHKINTFWESNISLSTSNQIIYDTNSSYILQNYRSLVNNDTPLHEIQMKNISYRLGYKNIINAIYSNLNFSYSNNISNILISTDFDGILTKRKALVQNNPYTDLNLNWSINKYYFILKSSFDLSLSYNRITSKQLQQNVLTDFCSNNYIVGTKVNSTIGKNITVMHSFELTTNKNSTNFMAEKTHFPSVSFLKQNLTFKYFLPKDFQTNINIEHYNNNGDLLKNINYCFTDFTIQKTLFKPKIDFLVSLSNIFNVKTYNNYFYDNNVLINSNYRLRERILMFKVKFQF